MSNKIQDPDIQKLAEMMGKEWAGRPLAEALAPGSDSPLAKFIGAFVQASLEQEMQEHLGYKRSERADEPRPNTRNGSFSKTLKTTQGDVEIKVPRDRNGEFEPSIITKGQRMTQELEQRVLALLEEGMTTRQIEEHLSELYHTKLSANAVSELAKKLDDLLKTWRSRPLERVYCIMIVDAIYIKIRGPRGVRSTAVYQVCAYDEHGRLEVLGVYLPDEDVSEESARFWHSIFIDLKNRGVEDVLYLCMDGLPGLPAAAEAVWPKVTIQPCVVHLVRNSLRHVSSKRRHEMAKDLRQIYQAATYEGGELALAALQEKWGNEHRVCQQWEENLPRLTGLFGVGPALRKKISTTNAIENLHSHERRYLKGHKSYPSRESGLRYVSLIARKLSNRNVSIEQIRSQWREVVNELHVLYPERLPSHWGYV